MATVDKTWTFASDAQGLADQGNSANLTFAWDSGDAAVKFTTTTKSTTITEYAYRTATGETWETWGVPAGATVTSIQITAWQEKTVAVTKLSSHSVTMYVMGSGGGSVTSGAGNPIDAANPGTGADASYQAGAAGSSRAVDAGAQASTTDVRLRINYTVTTTGTSGGASVDQRFDTIVLTITYTEGAVAKTAADKLGAKAGDAFRAGLLTSARSDRLGSRAGDALRSALLEAARSDRLGARAGEAPSTAAVLRQLDRLGARAGDAARDVLAILAQPDRLGARADDAVRDALALLRQPDALGARAGDLAGLVLMLQALDRLGARGGDAARPAAVLRALDRAGVALPKVRP